MTRFESALKISRDNTLGELEKIVKLRDEIRRLSMYLIFACPFVVSFAPSLHPSIETLRSASSVLLQAVLFGWCLFVVTVPVVLTIFALLYFIGVREEYLTWEMAMVMKRRGDIDIPVAVVQEDTHSGI